MHGDVNSAYRVRNHEWTQLAKGDPQDPQAFYQTKDPYDIKDISDFFCTDYGF